MSFGQCILSLYHLVRVVLLDPELLYGVITIVFRRSDFRGGLMISPSCVYPERIQRSDFFVFQEHVKLSLRQMRTGI